MNILAACSLLVLGVAAVFADEAGYGYPGPDQPPQYPEDDCLLVCTKEYEPVCAANQDGDSKTFASLCFLRFENCRDDTDYVYRSDGECRYDSEEATNEASR